MGGRGAGEEGESRDGGWWGRLCVRRIRTTCYIRMVTDRCKRGGYDQLRDMDGVEAKGRDEVLQEGMGRGHNADWS